MKKTEKLPDINIKVSGTGVETGGMRQKRPFGSDYELVYKVNRMACALFQFILYD